METAKGKVTLESGRLAHNKLFTGEDIMIPHIWKHFGNIVSMGISWELEGN